MHRTENLDFSFFTNRNRSLFFASISILFLSFSFFGLLASLSPFSSGEQCVANFSGK